MVILLTLLCVLAVVVAHISYYNDNDILQLISATGAVFIGIGDVIVICMIISFMFSGITAQEKIKMYQEENTKIETQIGGLVKEYMNYESDTYKEFKNDELVMAVNLYPNLKSDELVQSQMSIYLTNNNKIKELKEKKIDTKIGKWLLYFGN